MTRQDSSELAALVGIDWADQAHTFVLQEIGSTRRERGEIEQTPEAIAEFMTGLRVRFEGRPVEFCLETSRGPLVHALLEHDFARLYPVNPKTLRLFREAFAPSGAKDDPSDADLLTELLSKHRDRLRLWKPDDTETRMLARLTEARREAVDLRTKLTHELRAELKGYFPQALDWAGGELHSRLATDFLLRWSSLEAIQRAHPGTLRKFYYGHNCRRADLIQKRLEEIQAARPLTTDRAIIQTSVLKV